MKGNNQYEKIDTNSVIERFRKIHGDRYDYSLVEYKNMNTPVSIICNIHGIFTQTPHNHLKGNNCPICAKEENANRKRMSIDTFIESARKIHGDKYDYSKVDYKNNRTKVCIICPIHGEFWQMPCEHLKGSGCKQCALEYTAELRKKKSRIEFESRANKIHHNKYIYDISTYSGNEELITIYCPIHGQFTQRVHDHLQGCGCPKCGFKLSKAEDEISEYIESFNIKVEKRNKTLISPYELDIYLPDKHIAIEYNGLIWHSEKFGRDKNYHVNKTKQCNDKGVRLIHIFEDEWLEKPLIVKSMLSNILGVTSKKLFARKCIVKEVESRIANNFLENNHIQGKCKAKIHIGLYYNNELVSLMSFGNLRQMKKYNEDYNNTWELFRFCNLINVTVIGGASKLLKYFIRKYQPNKIITYADKRWSVGNLYNKIGFSHTHDSKPNYFYVIGQKRENRFKYRKGELVKKGYDINKSEHEIMLENQIYRIYDCGSMCFEMQIGDK